MLLAAVGFKLPGIEYDIQKEEAAYRKELVLGEDVKRAGISNVNLLYGNVRKIHFKCIFTIFTLMLLSGVIFKEW